MGVVVELEKEQRINADLKRLGNLLGLSPETVDRTFQYLAGDLPTMEKKDPTAHLRTAKWRDKKKAEGRKRLTAWMTPEAAEALTTIQERTGQTIDDVVSDALIQAAVNG